MEGNTWNKRITVLRTTFTIEDLKKSKVGHLNNHLVISPVKGKSKYGNNKKIVDGIKFDSEKEARRYTELKILLKAGEIGLLSLQHEFELNSGGEFSYKYIADFVYYASGTGEMIVEDTKGFLTREYKKKRRLMKKIYGITIKET